MAQGRAKRRGSKEKSGARPAAKTELQHEHPSRAVKSIRDYHKCKRVKPSRTGTCAERAVHCKGKKEVHDRAGTVTCEGEALN